MMLAIFSRTHYSAQWSFSARWTGQAFSSICSCSSYPWLSIGARSSLPLLAATLPLLAANILSSASTQRDLIHQYSLPLAVLLVVASMDGLAVDLRKGRLWLTGRLPLCYFWAALCFVILVNRGHVLGLSFNFRIS